MSNKLFHLERELSFFASHNLEGRPIHIHEFIVSLVFVGRRDNFSQQYRRSLLINYYDIDSLWENFVLPKLIDENKKIRLEDSSCENLAEWIFDEIHKNGDKYENCIFHSLKINDGDVSVTITSNE